MSNQNSNYQFDGENTMDALAWNLGGETSATYQNTVQLPQSQAADTWQYASNQPTTYIQNGRWGADVSQEHRQASSYSIPSNWSGAGSTTANLNVSHSSFGAAILPLAAQSTSSVIPVDLQTKSANNHSMSEQGHSGLTGGENKACSVDKEQQNRERNREHARSTRLRKKAYVQKLKEMATGLRAIQTEEIRQRRLAVRAMAEMQTERKRIVQKFLHQHATYEESPHKWEQLVEDDFTLKQPVTPFRSFRRLEVKSDCRMVLGVDGMICDAASLSVMIERIGSRNARWQRIKRKQFERYMEGIGIYLGSADSNQPAESSLSSSEGDSCDDSSSNSKHTRSVDVATVVSGSKRVISSSGESFGRQKKLRTNGLETQTASSGDTEVEPVEFKNKNLPNNIARTGGIAHNISAVVSTKKADHSALEASLPTEVTQAPLSVIQMKGHDAKEIGAYYAMNEDDMIIIDDVLMCPFVFRTKNAVLCGALADCVMPGMLRANYSKNNKLQSMEIVYDAMGFMQQLDGANGGQVLAQVIPGSLEMALMNTQNEARVITEARPPYAIVHVNQEWSKLTKFSQLDVEGKPLLSVIEGEQTNEDTKSRPSKPHHVFPNIAKGRSACSTNLHYDRHGNSFVDFMCSYPLRNAADEISHLLHISVELKDHALI